MDINYHAHQTPQFRILSDQQIERIYQATLECLNRTGVNVLNAEARDLLAMAGLEGQGLPDRMADINGVLDELPAEAREKILVSFVNDLFVQ